ncbi:hypothetical protein O6H91_12G046900 [Diphasiastrum complanatum]|uniref:Uncharacterized protein n=1 Tax=Diphasiastrum complanatum TaxID=34168 RepID=A0ACC2C1G9_DIPCM|nr:hypothetical protein O6H91_12G046900 [Diphasiastrum complanatum]
MAQALIWAMPVFPCLSSSSTSSAAAAAASLPASPLHHRSSLRTARALPTLLTITTSTTDIEAEALWTWLAQKGAVSDEATAVRPACVHHGRGLLAHRTISQGDELLSIPRKLWINLETVKASAIGRFCEGLKPWVAIALFLVREKAQSNSSWRPYLDILPQALDSPLFWLAFTSCLCIGIRGTQLLGSTLGYREYVESEVNELFDKVIKPNPDLFDSSLFTYDAFLWAFGILRSRTFAPLTGDELALVPLADLVNHLAGLEVEKPCWEKTTAGIFTRQEVLLMRAAKTFHAGQEVVMQYGKSKNNAQLALDYGLVEYDAFSGSNNRDSFMLTLEIPKSDRLFDDKLDIAQLNGLDSSVYFDLTRGQGPPESMLTFLRLTALGGSDAFLLEALFRNTVWDHLSSPVSRDNEESICEAMIEGCKSALYGYQSTVEEDLLLLNNDNLDPRTRIAVVVRQGEKCVLQEVQTWFEARMNELDQLEYYAERRLRDLGLLDEKGNMTAWARVWN